jgi:UDP-glucose 4-epimerase
LELAERIIEITNSKSPIQFLEERSGDIKHSKADPSKFNDLGFKPDYSIAAALEETIDFYHHELLKTKV